MISDLIELVDIISKKKIHQIEILTEDTNLNTKSKMLLDAIRSGEIKNDDDAHDLLYDVKNKTAYLKLRKRLFDRLLNTLFFIDVKKGSKKTSHTLRFDAYKTFSQIMIVFEEGKMKLAANMAKKLVDQVSLQEMSQLEFLLNGFLVEFFTAWEVNEKMAVHYQTKYQNSLAALKDFNEINPIWSKLGSLIITKKSIKLNSAELVTYETDLNNFKQSITADTSSRVKYKYYSAQYYLLWLKFEFEEQIALCKKAAKDLHTSQFPVHGFTFRMYAGIAHMNLQNYQEADISFQNILNDYPMTPGKHHWYNIYNYKFLTKIILKSYKEAAEALGDVVTFRGFKKMDPNWREPWLIKEAYIHILIKIQKIEDAETINLRPFRLRKFLNTVPHFFKDKSGLNVSILVAQFLFLLIDDKTEELHEKLDALKQYSHRYLKRDDTYRSNCFIRMLITLPKANFHPIGVEARTSDLWKKLKNTPMMVGAQSHEVEIIPYEHLWELVMDILHQRVGNSK